MASNKRKRIVFAFFSLFSVLVISLYLLVNQPTFLSFAVKLFVNNISSDIHVDELTIQRITWKSLQSLTVEDLRLKGRIKGKVYFYHSPWVNVSDLQGAIAKVPISIKILNSNIESDVVKISNAQVQSNLYFDFLKYKFSFSEFNVQELECSGYKIQNLRGSLHDNGKLLFFKKVSGNLYSGQIESVGWVKYVPNPSYDVNIKIIHVNSLLLSQVNPNFSQLKAIIDGDVRLKSQDGTGLLIEASLHAPAGGMMKAALLQFLAQYIPQKQQITDLIKQNKDLVLEKAQFKLLSVSSKDLSSEVYLTSPSINLNMNVKFDIHIEDGLGGLLEYATH